ncbi:secreted ookinete protein, putative [Hepatocystis sp. ex Piliocolobus tephrosceles]|nr:secreted ookinete protein, putative [Hepatocystis sp. ex Piliocolobus tephrosceles]
MNKFFFILSFFLYTIAAVKAKDAAYENFRNDLNNHLKRRQSDSGNKKNPSLKESIEYERKNNYELYIDDSGALQQERCSVGEPRQILKQNFENFRYLVNDLEIIFGVYKFNAYDKEKVLKETLKKESLCFTILGLLLNKINEIKVSDLSVYGFLINGKRDVNNNVHKTLDINIILSNVTVPLGVFDFPEVVYWPYQIPFLVGHYDKNVQFSKNSSFSYTCSLPAFLTDVIKTTTTGLKFNFNGEDLNVNLLFPATLQHAIENPKNLPILKEDEYKYGRNDLLSLIYNYRTEIPIIMMKNNGPTDKAIVEPSQRILANVSFAKAREEIKDALSRAKYIDIDSNSLPLYFIFLSANLNYTVNEKTSNNGFISKIKISNIKIDDNGNLKSYSIHLELENGNSANANGLVNGKILSLSKQIMSNKEINYTIPITYGLALANNGKGLIFNFANNDYDLKTVLPYNINKMTMNVTNQ